MKIAGDHENLAKSDAERRRLELEVAIDRLMVSTLQTECNLCKSVQRLSRTGMHSKVYLMKFERWLERETAR